jgi:hypothetical protein
MSAVVVRLVDLPFSLGGTMPPLLQRVASTRGYTSSVRRAGQPERVVVVDDGEREDGGDFLDSAIVASRISPVPAAGVPSPSVFQKPRRFDPSGLSFF